jgi:membrane protease YdiL (CAAX protease family)
MAEDVALAAGTPVMAERVEQPSLPRLVALHLLPGLLATVVYVAIAPLVMRRGFPALLAAYLVLTAVIIPIELGYLLYQGARRHGRPSLRGIVLYREPIPVWQYFVLVPLLLLWGLLVSALAFPVDNALLSGLFAWLPEWYRLADLPRYPALYSRGALTTTVVVGLALNAVAGPVVEELYFRGYLLPRLARFGRWAPCLNAGLFSLYHFWTPWQFVSRLLLLLPWVYVVWWKRSIYVGITTHCLVNTISILVIAGLLFR